MNKIVISALMIVGLSSVAHAEQHTVSVGYAQSSVSNTGDVMDDLKGVNLKYRYEQQASPWGVIASFSIMSSDYSAKNLSEELNIDWKNYSLSAGPAYRVNDYFSLYGLVGLNHFKEDWNYSNLSISLSEEFTRTSLMYGVGMQINPMSNLAIDVGYEGSSFSSGGSTHNINGFNVGLGYRF